MTLEYMALNMVQGLGPVRIAGLMSVFGSPRGILDAPAGELTRRGGLGYDLARQVKEPSLIEESERQLADAAREGVTVLTPDSQEYPCLLQEIFAPPPVLFVRGSIEVFRRHAVAVVGTRAPSQYGRSAAVAITRELAAANLVIVSGLALGIDAIAHDTCLEGGVETIAVLGCGIDMTYPRSNRRLADRIVEHGAIVSEFPVGMPPLAHNFPRRNRVISGLSAGTLVVEAGRRSGALITANYALQQGRDVFAVPGSIFSEKSVGTFNLIKNGATPARCGADIVDSIQAMRHSAGSVGHTTVGYPEDLLNEAERAVLSGLSVDPVRLDELVDGTGAAVPELLDTLLNLELKGVVKQLSGQQFVRA